ncbi:hypothetical protein OC846_002027, partial [Tilletia horrida]
MLVFILATLSTLFALGLATGAISAHILATVISQAGDTNAGLTLLVVDGFLTVAVILVLILLLPLISHKRSALLKVTCATSLLVLLPLWVVGAVLAQLHLGQLNPVFATRGLILAAKATAWTSTGWTVLTCGVSLYALRRTENSNSPALSDVECFAGPTAQQADKSERPLSRAGQQSVRTSSRIGQESIRSPSRLGQSSSRPPSRLGQNSSFLPPSSRWSRPDLSRGIEHIAKHTGRQSRNQQHGRNSARSSASADNDSINDDDWEFIDHGPSFAGPPRPAPVPPTPTEPQHSNSPSPIPSIQHVGDTPVTLTPKSRRNRSLPPNPNPAPSIPLPLTPPDSVVSRGVGKQR